MAVVNMRDSRESASSPTFLAPSPPEWTWMSFPRRYLIAIMAFFGFFNIYSLRVNLSIAIVAMTENRTTIHANGTIGYDQDFPWSSKEQGLLLSSFFYGYITTQLLGGWLAPKMGAGKLYGLGILTTAVLTLLTPLIADFGLVPLVAIRILEGIFEGVTFPAMHALWSRWAPPLERSKLVTIAYSGSYFGTVVSMGVCGLLAEHLGWASIFYVSGTFAVLWWILWFVLVKESPQEDRFIKRTELDYISNCLGSTADQHKLSVPWKSILTSLPVWATVAAHFAENWGFYTLLTQLPTFLSDTSDLKLDKTGFLAAIPYLAMAIIVQTGGQLADWLRSRWRVETTKVRKIFTCGAFVAQTIFMLATAYTHAVTAAIICLTIAVGFGGFAWSGFSVNHLDIAPQYASLIMGLSNTVATLPGIVSPALTGYIVQNKTEEGWHMVFMISSMIYLSGASFYCFGASGKLQAWASQSSRPRNFLDSLSGQSETTAFLQETDGE
ncbi:sialin-like isoform X1 [Daphnia pulex]|uniref:sialin-like isoform X1 n=1 Tax=Daphnia pulex TaxID=6669 RepID=UPI001EDD30CB|nr:sialin-like isoform X1 [Daphnia pulex]